MRGRRLILMLLSSLGASLAPGQAGAQPAPQAPAQAAAEDEEAKLLAILAEETAVATKTRMNGDFVPGIVTVLHGDELEAMGVETAWEALSLVPGMEAVRDGMGAPNVIVRGLEFPFNSGNVKVLIDGVTLSRQEAGINGIALQIPIQLVDRIEVIRGPGSVVYGDFAFMGLVNVITRKEGERVFARYGGDRAVNGGGQLAWQGGPWQLSLLGAGWKSSDAPAPAPNEADEKRGFGAIGVRRGGFSLTAEAITRRVEPSGPQGPLSPFGQTHAAVEGRYAWDLAAALRSEVRARALHNRIDAGGSHFTGSVGAAGLDLTWTRWSRHSVLLGVDYAGGTIDEAAQVVTPPPGLPAPPALMISDQRRDAFGLTLQDTFEVSKKLAATAGLRYDHTSDVGQRVTPRVSAVFRASDSHILKLQYAEGFRTPTFFELYATGVANPDLSFEVNKTGELNYIFRGPGTAARATLFYSKIVHMLFATGPGRFGNSREGRAYGVELEWERELTRALKATSTLSWVDAKDNRNFQGNNQGVTGTPPVTANWLGNAALLLRASPHTLLAARWNWIGERNSGRDNRGYQLVDLTATQNDVFARGLQLRAGVKNLFDDDVRYFSQRPDGGGTYEVFPGRTFFVQLAWNR